MERNMLWYVALIMTIASLSMMVRDIFLYLINEECHKIRSLSLKNEIIVYIIALGTSFLCFNIGSWLLFYKHWQVSFVVPLKFKNNEPSLRMTRCLNIVLFTGVLVISGSQVFLCYTIADNDLNFENYKNKHRN